MILKTFESIAKKNRVKKSFIFLIVVRRRQTLHTHSFLFALNRRERDTRQSIMNESSK